LTTLRTQVELGRALRKSHRLELENRSLRREGLPELIAESPVMQPVLHLMERVGPSDANVLILGEHGTGKEVVARWLHASRARAAPTYASSPRPTPISRWKCTPAASARICCFDSIPWRSGCRRSVIDVRTFRSWLRIFCVAMPPATTSR